MQRVLVVDDDVELCELLAQYLKAEGFDLEAVASGEQGVARALSGDHALVVLDVMLPGMQGFEVLRQIRAQSHIPVLMLTARGDDLDRILGLELGADDYLGKPFNPRELAARIRAVLRRAAAVQDEGPLLHAYRFGAYTMELGSRRVAGLDGGVVDLTGAEFDLLRIFVERPGRLLSRDQLLDLTQGRARDPFDRS